MVQSSFLEDSHARFGQADAGGDQVAVKAQLVGGADQLFQVLAHQRLAAGEAQLHGAQLAGLTKYLDPLLRAQFLTLLGEVQRVGTIGAL
ncbi:hypothetical protein D3C85_964420 [compost metagenome]